MKPILKISALLALFASLTSCGIPTAAVRTARNALKEVNSISDGTSSGYSDRPVSTTSL